MKPLNLCSRLFVITYLSALQCQAKILSGVLQTKEDWHFLTRFCFLSDKGTIRFVLSYPMEYAVQSLLLYYDGESQWPAVYKNDSKNCMEKRSVLNPEHYQIIDLEATGSWSGCTAVDGTYYCDTERSFHSRRERWWYIALSNCQTDNKRGMYLNYTITMTNGLPHQTFFYHFSADEFYIIQTDVTFFLLQLVLFVFSIYTASVLSVRQLYHTTYKLYMFSQTMELVHLLFMSCMNGRYANTGLKNITADYMGRMFRCISEMGFILMLILMAKGLTITRGRLRTASTVKITVFMTIYVVLYVGVFFWEATLFDRGLVLYVYESPPGYCLITLRLAAWAWFTYATGMTIKHYPDKVMFYLPFYLFYTLWFLSGPVCVLIAMKWMSPWVREKVVNAIGDLIAFCGFFFFLILTRPSAANRNFPYHVRTSQIAAMTDDVTEDGGVHYSSDGTETQVHFTDLFVVSKPQQQKSINIDRFPHAPIINNFILPAAPPHTDA